jgi:alpha-amylase
VLDATATEVRLERSTTLRSGDTSVPLLVTKRYRFEGDRRTPAVGLEVTVLHPGDAPIDARLALGWSLNLLGGGGNPAAWWDTGDGRVAFDSNGDLRDASAIACGNDTLGVTVRAETSSACDIWWASVDTVSISEDGFERTHQGSGLTFSWPLRLAAGASMTVGVRLSIATAFDRASETAA